jgi:hypothetical protein
MCIFYVEMRQNGMKNHLPEEVEREGTIKPLAAQDILLSLITSFQSQALFMQVQLCGLNSSGY